MGDDLQCDLFDRNPLLPFLFYTSLERDGQGFASPMSQMKKKKRTKIHLDNISFNIRIEDAEKLNNILFKKYRHGASFADTFGRMINEYRSD